MGTINRFVRGLLSSIDSQVQGVHPSSFGEQIVPTMDMGAGLQWSKGVLISRISAATAVNGKIVVQQPPPGKVWHVHAVGMELIQLDAVPTNWGMQLTFGDTVNDCPISQDNLRTQLNGLTTRIATSRVFAIPWQVTAPNQFAAWVQQATGAVALGVSVVLQVIYTEQSI